jgi:hypothetical protein
MSPHDLQRARATLGVREGASIAEINRAWRRLAKRYHPDRKGGDATVMSRVNQARDALLAPPPTAPIVLRPAREPCTYSEYLNLHRRAM